MTERVEPISARWQRVVEQTRGAPLPPVDLRLQAGDRLGRYHLLLKLATGGMASVWVATKITTQGAPELVALKTLLPHLAGDRGFVRMFLDEVGLLSQIRHPNVIEVRDVDCHGGLPYVALEWVDGDSLSTLLKQLATKNETLPLDVALRIVGEACLGLHTAHELRNARGELAGVIHRDVSPANIVLSAVGDVKLIDFGVAKAAERLSENTRTGIFKGKVGYMAPEVAQRVPIDRRVDVWAAGIVLYKLVAGQSPYPGNMMQIYHCLRSGESPRALPKSVPPVVADVIRGALQINRDERFSTAADMRRAIQFAAAELCDPVPKAELGRFVRRRLRTVFAERRSAVIEALAAHVST